MAVYETPVRHEDHYVERDTGTGAGFWAVVIVLAVLLLLLLFGRNIFGRGGSSNTGGGTNVNGTVETPSGTYQGSGSVTQ
jgi:hypothetical protein